MQIRFSRVAESTGLFGIANFQPIIVSHCQNSLQLFSMFSSFFPKHIHNPLQKTIGFPGPSLLKTSCSTLRRGQEKQPNPQIANLQNHTFCPKEKYRYLTKIM